nr:katanin p60 ATPase-containing subunit A1 [Tanacetum cinerariifolium]
MGEVWVRWRKSRKSGGSCCRDGEKNSIVTTRLFRMTIIKRFSIRVMHITIITNKATRTFCKVKTRFHDLPCVFDGRRGVPDYAIRTIGEDESAGKAISLVFKHISSVTNKGCTILRSGKTQAEHLEGNSPSDCSLSDLELLKNKETKEHTSKLGKYEGPDHDLATMLGQDVLEDTLRVKFDDVAGLNEAKNNKALAPM